MNFRKLFIILGLFICTVSYSQNKQILYGFAEMPNTLMLNPGAETNFKYHAGIPFLSGFPAKCFFNNSKESFKTSLLISNSSTRSLFNAVVVKTLLDMMNILILNKCTFYFILFLFFRLDVVVQHLRNRKKVIKKFYPI